MRNRILDDPRFKGVMPFENKIWLATPTMHGDEERWVVDAIKKNWVTTVGENIDKIEHQIAGCMGESSRTIRYGYDAGA